MKALKQRCLDCRGSYYATSYNQRCHFCETVFRNKSAAEKKALEQQRAWEAKMMAKANMAAPPPATANYAYALGYPPDYSLEYDPGLDAYIVCNAQGFRVDFIPFPYKDLINGKHRRTTTAAYSNSTGQSGATNSGTLTNAALYAAYNTVRTYSGGGVPAQPAREIPHAGIRAGEIIGWRAWKVRKRDDGNYRLTSMYVDHIIWEPGVPMGPGSAYTSRRHKSIFIDEEVEARIGIGDNYGVHAYKKPLDVINSYCSTTADVSLLPVVIGQVALWGEVIEHEDGYRAEFGKPKSFIDITFIQNQNDAEKILEELRRDYLQ